MEQPEATPDEIKDEGHFSTGCAAGCAIQAVLMLVALGLFAGTHAGAEVMIVTSLTQWVTLVPFIWAARSRGAHRTALGFVVSICISILLATACALMIL